eukprot:jgi/Ulvmu1/9786/UM056_0026.1
MEGSGFVEQLNNDRMPVLRRIYSICLRVQPAGPQTIREMLHAHVKAVGQELVQDGEASKDAVVFSQRVLDLRRKYATIVSEAFNGDRLFLQAVNHAFESFVNAFPRSAEYISLYIDQKLRRSLSSATDALADSTLNEILQIFRYLQDKDLFERYYKQHLSRRLLNARNTNDDAEHSMLSKLKTECGYQFTSKLESMFMDIKTSQETMQSFRAHLREHGTELQTEISVQVLTTGSWPASAAAPCTLPAELESCTAAFEEFYKHKHSGRQLQWHPAMGTADLKATIRGKRVMLTVTTYQMVVLMLLNDQPSISFSDLLRVTQIPKDDLKPALIGLSMVKGKALLKKSPSSKEFNEGDVFSFNEKFDSKLMKIKFAAAGAQKEVDMSGQTRQKVEEDRKHIIEAAIVRIMKARRVLDYNSIVTEVTRQMSGRFVPVATDIKKRIESLIEREFIERDGADRKMYRYLA